MGYKVEEIEGIGPAFAEKLNAAGVATTDQLLRLCADPKGRKALAEKSGLRPEQLLKWANLADLMRIPGVARQNAELLEAAGVDTVKELKTRRADALQPKLAELNKTKKLSGRPPGLKEVSGWIEFAATLEPAITY